MENKGATAWQLWSIQGERGVVSRNPSKGPKNWASGDNDPGLVEPLVPDCP